MSASLFLFTHFSGSFFMVVMDCCGRFGFLMANLVCLTFVIICAVIRYTGAQFSLHRLPVVLSTQLYICYICYISLMVNIVHRMKH